jgi:glycosyltransferase involved in cell wall biosynthesis
MAAGLPIVAADCAAVPETAPHGEVSLLVEPDDLEALAATLVRLLKDEDLRARLAAAGTARWQQFGWPEVARRFLAEAGLG